MSAYIHIFRDGGDPEVTFEPRGGYGDASGLLRFFVSGSSVAFEEMDSASIERLAFAVAAAGEVARKHEGHINVLRSPAGRSGHL
jgi:hypothetical protein